MAFAEPADTRGSSVPAAADLPDPRSLEDVISIHCYGRSGSLFLASLLDSHPRVLTIPGAQLSSFYEFWRGHGELPAFQMFGVFLATFKAIYKVHQPENVPIFGDMPLEGPPSPVDEGLFVDSILALLAREVGDIKTTPVSRKYFFQALHAAYAFALGRRICWEKAVIVFSLHEPQKESARALSEDFPAARFLHAVREPVRSLDSWFDMMLPRRGCDSPFVAVGMANMMVQAKAVIEDNAERSRAVRLEDLHTHSRETLARICAWTGLQWHDSLMHSTFNGIPYRERVAEGTVEGFQTRTISRKAYACLRPFDVIRLKFLYAHIFPAWNYPIAALYRRALLGRLVLLFMFVPFRVERLVWNSDTDSFSFAKLGIKIDRYIELRRVVMRIWRADRGGNPRFIELVEAAGRGAVDRALTRN